MTPCLRTTLLALGLLFVATGAKWQKVDGTLQPPAGAEQPGGPPETRAFMGYSTDQALARELAMSVNSHPRPTPSARPDTLVLIDAAVAGYRDLIAGARPGLEVLVLEQGKDGVREISRALRGRTGLSSLHIVSHGAPGVVALGTTRLSMSNLGAYAREVRQWAASLKPGADLLLYGCRIASGEDGRALVRQLGRLVKARVAASENLTGSRELGGDWQMEYTTGPIAAAPAFRPEVMAAYASVLDLTFILPRPGEDLQINGDAQGHRLAVSLQGSTYTLTLSGGGVFRQGPGGAGVISGRNTETITFDAGQVRRIFFDLGGGDDTVTFTGTSAASFPNAMSLDGGGGKNTLDHSVAGGAVFQNELQINHFGTINLNYPLEVRRGETPADQLDGSGSYALSVLQMNPPGRATTINLAEGASIQAINGSLVVPAPSEIKLLGAAGTNRLSAAGQGTNTQGSFFPIVQLTQVSAAGGAQANLSLSSSSSLSLTLGVKINGSCSATFNTANRPNRTFNFGGQGHPIEAGSVALNGTHPTSVLSIPDAVVSLGEITLTHWSRVRLDQNSAAAPLSAGGGNLTIPGTLQVGTPVKHGPFTITPPQAGALILGTAFEVNLRGTTAGGGDAGYSQLTINRGALSLNDAVLTITLGYTNATYLPRPGDTFTIIDKLSPGPVTGTFKQLPEGATVNVGTQAFRISYRGGDGNDVVLTAL